MLEVLKKEQERVARSLREVNPADETYRAVLTNLSFLMDLTYNVSESTKAVEVAEGDAESDFVGESDAKVDHVEEPIDAEAEESESTPTATLDRSEVRKEIGQLRVKGVNVLQIIRDMGYESYPQVPDTELGELLARCREDLS